MYKRDINGLLYNINFMYIVYNINLENSKAINTVNQI